MEGFAVAAVLSVVLSLLFSLLGSLAQAGGTTPSEPWTYDPTGYVLAFLSSALAAASSFLSGTVFGHPLAGAFGLALLGGAWAARLRIKRRLRSRELLEGDFEGDKKREKAKAKKVERKGRRRVVRRRLFGTIAARTRRRMGRA